MTEENQQSEQTEIEGVEHMPLVERLSRCKSRKAARESIADYCEEIGVKPTEFKLPNDCLWILQSLH